MIVLQQLVNGISLGSIYALIALGFSMVYGIAKLLNFAHGDVLMIGAYTGFFVLSAIGMGLQGIVFSLIIAMIVCVIFALSIERLAYRPLRERGAPRLNYLITAIAVSLIIQNTARILPFMGPTPRRFPHPPIRSIQIVEGLSVSNIQIIIVVLSAILMLILNFIVNYTKRGKAMRAVSFDPQAASLMGISVSRTIAFTFALGATLAGAGGVLFASAYPLVNPTMGMMPGLKAFVAAVLGGIGSVPGAMLGGYVLGIAEIFAAGFISSQFADAISFAILIIVLLFRPSGILGKNFRAKV
ncbi:MAG: branched-chain amino acid ABC transporter permease [Treponema sp.]|nr:branched-chain amino acid ABC transporter permease [Treponema sp.]